jgi:hypothetical protein
VGVAGSTRKPAVAATAAAVAHGASLDISSTMVVQPVDLPQLFECHVATRAACCPTCPALTGIALQYACSRGLPCAQAHLCAPWLPPAPSKQFTSTTPAAPARGKRASVRGPACQAARHRRAWALLEGIRYNSLSNIIACQVPLFTANVVCIAWMSSCCQLLLPNLLPTQPNCLQESVYCPCS